MLRAPRKALGNLSLTAIGGRKKFWHTEEQKLEGWLQQQDYTVVFANVRTTSFEILPLVQRQAVVHELHGTTPLVNDAIEFFRPLRGDGDAGDVRTGKTP